MTDNRFFRGTWEQDGDISPLQTEFATANRIPFLTSPYPRWCYVTGIIVEDHLYRGEIPTDEEVGVIAEVRKSYQDYFFPEPNAFRAEMERFAPYDIDGGAAGFYFIKKRDGNWAYRRSTWTQGRLFVPSFDETPMTLAEVIDSGSLRLK